MFRQQPRIPVDFYFQTMRGGERYKCVNEYIVNLQDCLRQACRECQVMNDAPSYIMKDKQGRSQILHHIQLLLITPEVERGIPLCIGVSTTWARCTSSTLDEPTPEER